MKKPTIRFAKANDLHQITDIYNHYVINTAITFDLEPWATQARIPWLQQFKDNSRYACFILESGTPTSMQILGYACSTKLRPKAAYDSSVETIQSTCTRMPRDRAMADACMNILS